MQVRNKFIIKAQLCFQTLRGDQFARKMFRALYGNCNGRLLTKHGVRRYAYVNRRNRDLNTVILLCVLQKKITK